MIYFETNPDLGEAVERAQLERAALAALRHQSAPQDADLTLVVSDDPHLRQLNRDYLGVDAPTDVLSFPADESDPETGRPYLGDIVISVPRAAAQAQSAGHPLEAEMQLLVVHGVLHLMGHDHAAPKDKERMWADQAAILKELGLGGIKVGEI